MNGRHLAALLVAACVFAALVKLRPLWRNFDTVQVAVEVPVRQESPGVRLDAVLLDNLAHLRHVRAFDHVFAGGQRTQRQPRSIWLDRCEVRQGDFYKFVGWRAFNPAAPIAAPDEPADWRYDSDSRDHAVSGRLDAPANGVTWFDAYAYCRAAGGRLPNAGEWIAAATGAEQRLYPWGDAFDPAPWPHLDPLLNAVAKCGAHPATDTPAGIADMGQNVSEWAAADGQPGAAALVMGGNAYNTPRELYSLAVLHRRAPARYRSPYLGFRCAYDAPPRSTPWRTESRAVALPAGEYAVGVPAAARVPSLLARLPRGSIPMLRDLFERAAADAPTSLHFTVREISRGEYAAFLRDPFVFAGFHAEENQPESHSHRPPDWDAQRTRPELPVVNVDWWSAYAYASWAGGRLPTAEEWESAVSGQGQRVYPWGNDFAAAAPVTGERALGGPEAARAERGDATPEGLLAMGGNVSEWTRSVSTASGAYAVIVKGGNYLLPGADTARVDYSGHVSPNYRSPALGFRVVFERPR